MLFSNKPIEDHGESLVQEFEDFVEHLRDRVFRRHEVVKQRLAALEDEQTHLASLGDKLGK